MILAFIRITTRPGIMEADLADPAVEALLERHCEHRNMRGIRFMVTTSRRSRSTA